MKKYLTLAAALFFSCFNAGRSFAAPMGAGFYDTSEYLMGKVVVSIIFPESTGSAENWDDVRKADVRNHIYAAMSWWVSMNPAAKLSFEYETATVPTSYEPINCNVDTTSPPTSPPCTEEDWVNDIMGIGVGKLGYTDTDYRDKVYHYNNDIRDEHGADWAFTIFVVDSYNDIYDTTPGMFPDEYFAYSYLGGPFMVMTYDNSGYGIDAMDAVAAHETGHIFYALDEYTDSDCDPHEEAGYLKIANANCQKGGSSNVSCIMRGDIYPYYPSSGACPTCNGPAICSYSRNMLGWRDSNSNGIPDISDLPPTTVLYSYSPDPTSNNAPVYTGMVHSTSAYTNSNTYDPATTSHGSFNAPSTNISILKIAGVEYRTDGGGWLQATPQDGAFDETIENFTFTSAALADAPHTFWARAKDDFGNYDPSPPSDSLTVNTAQPDDIAYVFDGLGTDISYVSSLNALSANWGASVYPGGVTYEYAIGTTSGDTDITAGWNGIGVSSVTHSGLTNLIDGALYYFAVRAVGVLGGLPVYSGVTVSNGQRVDVTSPTAKVEISSLPAKTGALSLKLIVTETNGLTGNPTLNFTPASGSSQTVTLNHLVLSTWTGSAFIESFCSTGTATFAFRTVDLAGNIGSVITGGGTFLIDTAVSGTTGGSVVNSDHNAVTVPAGAYADNLVIRISTVSPSRTALAESYSFDSYPLPVNDLTREFTAKTPAGLAVTSFDAPLTVKLCYPDSNNDGAIDGDYIAEDLAGLYWLDETSSRWKRVQGAVRDAAANCISAPTTHFSIYAIRVADTSQSGMDKLKAYPNPCYFDLAPFTLTIKGIPLDAQAPRVYIYNTAGELVRTLQPGDGLDSENIVEWDGRDKSGAKAASGLYLYLAKTANYGKGSGKFYIFW